MSCSYSASGSGACISSSVAVKSGSESGLQSALANIGPIAVAVDARSNAFRVSCFHKDYTNVRYIHTLYN